MDKKKQLKVVDILEKRFDVDGEEVVKRTHLSKNGKVVKEEIAKE